MRGQPGVPRMSNSLLHSTGGPPATDLGLLLLRLVAGGFLAYGHGLPKALNHTAILSSEQGFPDPLGIGMANSLYAAIACELVFGTLVMVGLGTRLATLPVIFSMCVAGFLVHAQGPLWLPAPGAKEPALLYASIFATIFLAGPGRISVDGMLNPSSPAQA